MPVGDCIQYFAGRISAGDSFRVRWECRDCRIPAFRRFTVVNRGRVGCQLWKLFLVCGKQIHPITAQFSSSLSQFGLEILMHFRWNQELKVRRPAVSLSEPLTRERDADARCNRLTKGSGRCLNSGSPTILRMSGALTLELSEILQIIQRNCELAQGFIFSIYRLHSC